MMSNSVFVDTGILLNLLRLDKQDPNSYVFYDLIKDPKEKICFYTSNLIFAELLFIDQLQDRSIDKFYQNLILGRNSKFTMVNPTLEIIDVSKELVRSGKLKGRSTTIDRISIGIAEKFQCQEIWTTDLKHFNRATDIKVVSNLNESKFAKPMSQQELINIKQTQIKAIK